MYYSDSHVHSSYSDDSFYPMKRIVEDAIAKGIKELCFTEHVDYGVKPDWDCADNARVWCGKEVRNVDYPRYFEEVRKLKEEYEDRILIKAGLEYGMEFSTTESYRRLDEWYHPEFTILSIHQINGKEFTDTDYFKYQTQEEYQGEYYRTLYELVKAYKNYHVLGHLDVIDRYDPVGPASFDLIKGYTEEILKQVIADGRGIEFNTSYHRYHLSETTPKFEILRQYKELGGSIITIGSDSHEPAHLGAYFDEAAEILKSLGYEYHCTFDGNVPLFHEL